MYIHCMSSVKRVEQIWMWSSPASNILPFKGDIYTWHIHIYIQILGTYRKEFLLPGPPPQSLLSSLLDVIVLLVSETYSEPSQASRKGIFDKIVNSWSALTVFEKRSILVVWLGFEWVSVFTINYLDGFSVFTVVLGDCKLGLLLALLLLPGDLPTLFNK